MTRVEKSISFIFLSIDSYKIDKKRVVNCFLQNLLFARVRGITIPQQFSGSDSQNRLKLRVK